MGRKPSRLKLALVQQGLLAYEVGRSVGLSDTTMCSISVGRLLPTEGQAKALASKLGMKVSQLFDEFKTGAAT